MTKGASHPSPLVAERYRRLGVIGRGATGTVHRAYDRGSGRFVALKSVALDGPGGPDATAPTLHATRRAELLAREFRLLAGLRHPNVVAALDYGLEARGRPFFTMDLQEGACTLVEAARGRSLADKIDLLVQLLHALAYLHQRGLVHRDVKPSNVLVASGVVKLIDFGLTGASRDAGDGACGTPAYAAPELLRGGAGDARADLWAVGVLAYQLLFDEHPFDAASPERLLRSVFLSTPRFDRDGVDAALAAALARLLAREPSLRFGGAHDVIAALTTALGRPFPVETASTRESFLQGAGLVGRDAELARLVGSLATREGRAPVVVRGESGAGKTRLVDELAVEAMVRGVHVLRGQARREGARPYEPWRGVLRPLAVLADPEGLEGSVVAGVVPDAAARLGWRVKPAPELDPDAAHVRLVRVVESLLRRAGGPSLVVLEDMQWAGSESLKLLSRVQAMASELDVLLVATWRDDERAELPPELADAAAIALGRLSAGAIDALCASVLGDGDGARRGEVTGLVLASSGGNAFLALDALRALADEAGGLSRVYALPVGEQPRARRGERRGHRLVERLADEHRAFLRTAAVAGRELDLEVLARVHPELDVEACAARGVEAAVLASVQGRFWFSHDKIRESLVEEIADAPRRVLHGKIAAAVAALTPSAHATLAYHYRRAGDDARERRFAALAGDEFLRSGAYHEAIGYLRRALELSPPGQRGATRAALERRLGEALFRSGQLAPAREALASALASLGRPLPGARPTLALALLAEAAGQLALRVARRPPAPPPADAIARSEEAILAYTQLSRLAHHLNDDELLLYVTLSALNLSERGGLSAHHARLAAVMGAVMGLLPVHRWARFYFAMAQRIRERVDDDALLAFVLAHRGYYEAGIGAWEECRDDLERSRALYESIGDVRLAEESTSILAYALFYKGEIARSLELYRALERSGEERVDKQIIGWGVANRVKVLVRSGQLARVDELLARVDELLVDGITSAVADGVRVELALARGDLAAARDAAIAASERLERSPPRSFMAVSSYAAVADALLAAWSGARADHARGEARRLRRLARRANRALAKVARVFPIAEPAKLLHAGTFEALSGRPRRARALFQRAADLARDRELPFEEALASAALAMSPDEGRRAEMRERAERLLDRLGAAPARRRTLTPT